MMGIFKSTVLLIAWTAFLSQTAFSAVTHLPQDVRERLKEATGAQARWDVWAIPTSVQASFAQAARERIFAMANPRAEWQATDLILKAHLPHRRLKNMIFSKSLCIIFYELGGFGRTDHVIVFRLTGDHADLVWRAAVDQTVADVPNLLKAIDKGDADDNPRSYF